MAKSYCPISLLSILGKYLESIVNARIVRVLEQGGLLSPFQLSFRKGKEAIDAAGASPMRWWRRCRPAIKSKL